MLPRFTERHYHAVAAEKHLAGARKKGLPKPPFFDLRLRAQSANQQLLGRYLFNDPVVLGVPVQAQVIEPAFDAEVGVRTTVWPATSVLTVGAAPIVAIRIPAAVAEATEEYLPAAARLDGKEPPHEPAALQASATMAFWSSINTKASEN